MPSRDDSSNWQIAWWAIHEWPTAVLVKNLRSFYGSSSFTHSLISLEFSLISFISWSTGPADLHHSCSNASECYHGARCSLHQCDVFPCVLFPSCLADQCLLPWNVTHDCKPQEGSGWELFLLSWHILGAKPALQVSWLGCPDLPFHGLSGEKKVLHLWKDSCLWLFYVLQKKGGNLMMHIRTHVVVPIVTE